MPAIKVSYLYILLLVFISLTIATYYHRFPTGDDAWFGEQSYWLNKEGIIRSEYFRGIFGWEKQLLVSHKLFLAFGAVLIHFFGFHLPVLQFTGLIFFLILAGEIVFYIRSRKPFNAEWYVPVILILVFSNRLLIKMSFENRPEMMLAALGFGSFLLVNNIKRSNLKNFVHVTFAGILAGFAFLTHMNGIIYMIGGFGMLIYHRRYKDSFVFVFAGGIICFLYLVDIFLAENGIETWLFQFKNDPATQTAFGLIPKLLQIVTYPIVFFHSPEQIALSLLLVYLIWFQRQYIKLLPSTLKVYALIIFLSFWLITKGNAGMYMVLFMPFMFALVFELYAISPFSNTGIRIVLAVYFIIGVFGSIQIIKKNLEMEYIPVAYKKLSSKLPAGEAGVVPLTFFYNEYESFPRLLTTDNFKLQTKKDTRSADQFAKWARKNGADFILMDYKFNSESFYPKPGTKKLHVYNLTFFDDRFAIYQSDHL